MHWTYGVDESCVHSGDSGLTHVAESNVMAEVSNFGNDRLVVVHVGKGPQVRMEGTLGMRYQALTQNGWQFLTPIPHLDELPIMKAGNNARLIQIRTCCRRDLDMGSSIPRADPPHS